MLNRRVLTTVLVVLATAVTTQSIAQARGTGAAPAAGTFTSDAIPWKVANPKYPAVKMFAVWGNPSKGGSETLLKFPAGYHTGWHCTPPCIKPS